jgi:IclR family transcriptional regulator, pca regulon regulatory protein
MARPTAPQAPLPTGDQGTGRARSGTVNAVARAFELLMAFDDAAVVHTAGALSNTVGLPRPTTYRLLATLVDLGLVRRVPGGFALTARVLRLSNGYLAGHGLARRAQPVLDELAEAVGEHCSVAVLDGDDVVGLATANSPHSRLLPVAMQVGQPLPADRTSLGRVLLAYSPDHRSPDPAVEAERAQIRAEGYVVTDGRLDPSLRSLAAPVRDRSGRVVAAVAVAARAADYDRAALVAHALAALRAAATRLEAVA